jgi:hypothetical protein
MSRSGVLALVAALMASSPLMTNSAAATEKDEAIRLCEKNPRCKYRHVGNGGVDIIVGNGESVIFCPAREEGQLSGRPSGKEW